MRKIGDFDSKVMSRKALIATAPCGLPQLGGAKVPAFKVRESRAGRIDIDESEILRISQRVSPFHQFGRHVCNVKLTT
jgi:hypothetical protein